MVSMLASVAVLAKLPKVRLSAPPARLIEPPVNCVARVMLSEEAPPTMFSTFETDRVEPPDRVSAVSYTHLTLPTNREV